MGKKDKKLNDPLKSMLDDYFSSLNSGYLAELSAGSASYMEEAADMLSKQSLALCIGAGVTREYIGTWGELLNSLMTMRCFSSLQELDEEKLIAIGGTETTVHDIRTYMKEHIPTYIRESVNYLERGEYLMYDSADTSKLIGTQDETKYRELYFAQQVKYTVAEGIRRVTAGYPSVAEYYYQKYCKEDAEENTLTGVVKLCIKKKIREIVTYNFDTVLDRLIGDEKIRQYYFHEENPDYLIQIYSFTSTDPVLTLPKGKIPGRDTEIYKIYHVHGILDEDCETAPIIFSENSYQSYQNTSLNWSNIHLADVMTRYNTLCVGFSGDDSNFRMLRHFLDNTDRNPVLQADRENRKKLYLMRDYSWDLGSLLDYDAANRQMACAYACIKTYFDILITYFQKQLNATIIWSNGFQDMAQQLAELADWPSVRP